MFKQLLPGGNGTTRYSYLEISRFFRALNLPVAQVKPSWRCQQLPRCSHFSTLSPCQWSEDDSFILTRYKNSITFPPASIEIHQLAEIQLRKDDTIPVVLHGFLGSRNDLSKNLSFVPLLDKDLNRSVQIVSSSKSATEKVTLVHEELKKCQPHTPVVVVGILKRRVVPSSSAGEKKKQIRHVEVELQDLQCLNSFPSDINMEAARPASQRYLQIRQDEDLRRTLTLRSDVVALCGRVLQTELGFLNVETPLLFKSTPEGAREFMVPTRQREMAYALPQSPQQFKQMLMASGISRYYQVARCFRDEDLRADRQPEFTQLDMEMAFASSQDVMKVVESLVSRLWHDFLDGHVLLPFPQLQYQKAMSIYGSDKPDLRIGMPIDQVTVIPADLVSKITPLTRPVVDMLRFPGSSFGLCPSGARKFIGAFLDSPDAKIFNENPSGAPGIFVYDSSKPLRGLQSLGFGAADEIEKQLKLVDGDILVLQARPDVPFSGGSTPMGDLRLAIHREAVQQELSPPSKGFSPLWVTDFPLFSPENPLEVGQGGMAGLASTHHPFTSPKTARDVDLLLTDPSKVVGDHYDLVMNGVELGGGSRRIHHAGLQRFIMESILKMPSERVAEFDHLLEALRAGCPPHAGMALGFDRLIALMAGKDSVRDVIAFPKGKRGEDIMVKSPGRVSEEVLQRYHLQLRSTAN